MFSKIWSPTSKYLPLIFKEFSHRFLERNFLQLSDYYVVLFYITLFYLEQEFSQKKKKLLPHSSMSEQSLVNLLGTEGDLR